MDFKSSEERVGKLLESLPRIEAPGDFDFRVKARIAKGRPSTSNSWLPASLKVALPLVLLLVGGYVTFSVMNSSGEANVPVIADAQEPITTVPKQPEVQTETLASAQPIAPTNDVRPIMIDNKMVARTGNNLPVAPLARPKDDEDGGGSFDEALTESRPILPGGFDPASRPRTPNSSGQGQVSVRSVMGSLGINARFASGWHVSSVSPGSVAARAGVKVGDIVEAINSRNIGEASTFESGFSGSSLRVRRGGEVITLMLSR